MYFIFFYFAYINVETVNGFWPPAYKINLTHHEIFEIGDDNSNYKELVKLDDELIKEVDLKEFNIENDFQKFSNLHKEVSKIKRRHSKLKKKNRRNKKAFPKNEIIETNFDMVEPKIFWSGFSNDKNLDSIFNLQKRSTNETQPVNDPLNNTNSTQKLEKIDKIHNHTDIDDYDYYAFKVEYYNEMQKALRLNSTYNSTNHREEESVKEAIHTITDFKKPQNCTKEESKGIGLDAIECIWEDYNKVKPEKKRKLLLKRLWNIMMTWLLIYVFIGIPIWCQTGWCCCCLQCKFCKPQEVIIQAKGFLARNPPGTFLDTNKVIIEYKATEHEIDAFNNLDLALRNL